jgi:transposase
MSTLKAQLHDEIDRLEKVQAELAAIANRTDEERKRELIGLRRKLSEQIARVGEVAERFFSQANNPELVKEFRRNSTNMRSKAASHQANWPAIRLDEADEEYQSSARTVRDANRALVAWIRANLHD